MLTLLLRTSLLFFISTSTFASCIGVITVGSDFFFGEIHRGIKQASLDLDVPIYSRASSFEENTLGQERMIENALKVGCKGFVVAPSGQHINDIIAQLKVQDIPTVYIDRDYGGERESIISTNNYLAGKKAGEKMIAALKGTGNVILFRLREGIASTHNRAAGFRDALKDSGLTIVAEPFIGTTMDLARANSAKVLKETPNVQGVFTPNELTTVAVYLNLKQMGKAGEFPHIGFDAHPTILEAIQEGDLTGTFIQDPFTIGYQGVEKVHAAMQGKKVEERIDIPTTFVDGWNINTPEVKQQLGL